MNKKKSNLNWYFLIAGAVILYFALSKNKSPYQNIKPKPITVELSKDITNVKGRESSIDYKLWTKEYHNQFNILNGSISRGKHESISNLKAGQKVDLLIRESDFTELSKSKKDITVMGLSLNGSSLMTYEEASKNRSAYKNRLTIFYLLLGFMLLINGLTTVPRKINYAAVGIFAGAFFIMRIFEFGIY